MDGMFLISIDIGLEDYIDYDGSGIQINDGPLQVRHVENAVLKTHNDVMDYVLTFRKSITCAQGLLNDCLTALDETITEFEQKTTECDYENDETINYAIRYGKAHLIIQVYNLGSFDKKEEETFSHSVIFQYSNSEEEDVALLTEAELLDDSKVKEFLETLLNEYELTSRVIPSAKVYVDLIQAMFADARLHGSETTCVIPLDNEDEVTVILVPETPDYSLDTSPPTEGAAIH